MFMTVLKANADTLKNREYPVDFNNGDFLHKWLTSQFGTNRKESNILFSLCYEKKDIFFYIQSDKELPKKNIERAGMAFVKSFELPKVENGDHVFFRLYCTTDKTDKETGTRKFLNSEKDRAEWIVRKTSNSLSNVATKEIRLDQTVIKSNAKKNIRIPGVEFLGTGTVTDKDAFYEMIRNGIGRCKNYGFGLMMYKVG